MSLKEWKTTSVMWIILFLPAMSLPGCGLLGVTSPSGDVDGDGVRDALDQCSNTPAETPVDATGCPVTGDADTDEDGIPDSEDDCANTEAGAPVDATGCAPQQLDGDSDGVSDAMDECDQTPVTVDVDDRGCPVSAPGTADSDDDGVPDDIDECANTPTGADVDDNGCAESQTDTDSDDDGVPDDIDECANTPTGADVDANGCAESQSGTDSDDDGVPDDIDECANTPIGASVNSNGCAASQLDTDGDGVHDDVDQCPDTPELTQVDANGCPVITPPLPMGPAPVVLGTAGDFVILAKSGIDTVPQSVVTGDIGVSPIDSTAITGFSLTLDASTEFATSAQVTGRVFAADFTPPTPTTMTTAISDMETAYTDAAGRSTPDFTELGAGDISGLTLVPGLYKWGTGVLISTDVTLNGGADDIWVFQIAGGITQASATNVIVTGGALPKNIFWQVFGAVAIDANAHFEGVILCQTEITLATGASINGRLLSQTAVTLDQSTVTQPAP